MDKNVKNNVQSCHVKLKKNVWIYLTVRIWNKASNKQTDKVGKKKLFGRRNTSNKYDMNYEVLHNEICGSNMTLFFCPELILDGETHPAV